MPPPAERRKSSKQLLEEKQIKRFLRAKKRSRTRGAKQREEDIAADKTQNGRELEDSPSSNGELKSQENAMEKIPGDDTENRRVLEDSPCSKEEVESTEKNIIRPDESRDGKRWMEYKITKVVSIERNITYVKVPKQFLQNKNI